jgi:hypothetical protein
MIIARTDIYFIAFWVTMGSVAQAIGQAARQAGALQRLG